VLGAFGVLGVLGYVAAVLAVHQIFLAMRYTREAADLGASLFALVPYAVTPLLDPVLVDAGAWALTLWAWWAWLSGRSVVSAALLGGAVLCRETSLLLVPCIAHHGWRHRVPWSRISGVVMTAGVALLLPRLLVEPAFALDLTSLMKIVVRHKVRMWTEPRGFAIGFLESTAYGLGLGSLLLPLAWREVMRPPLVYSAWLLVAFGAVTTFVSLEIGRLLVTASLVVAGAAVAYLARLPPGLRRVATVVLLGGGLVVTAAWCYGRGASRAVAVAWLALGVVLCLAYRRGRLLAPEAAAMRARGPSSGGPAGAD
jgi:hypothetical protein